MKRRSEAGFTIIELVVVIALLGLLAAVALPRFTNLRGDAQLASFNGVKGGFASAVALTHAKWLAQNGGNVTMDGAAAPIVMDANGWPDLTDPGQTSGALLYPLLMQDGLPAGWNGPAAVAGVITLDDGNGNSFTYTQATGAVN